MIRALIAGTKKLIAEVIKPSTQEPPGIVAYTSPLIRPQARNIQAMNDEFGIDLNQAIAFTGTPELIHDGIDTVAWTGTILTGNPNAFIFDSATQANTGIQSVDATSSGNNDEGLFTAPSSVDMSGHVALTGFIYISSFVTSGTKDIEFRFRLAGIDVGITVSLTNFVDTSLLNTWQKFIIRKEDFNLASELIDEFIVKTIDIGGGAAPDYFLDDIQIEESGGSIVYIVEPDKGTVFNIQALHFLLRDEFDTALINASVPNLPPSAILGISGLAVGIIIRAFRDNELIFNAIIRDFSDLLEFPFPINMDVIGDPLETVVKLTFTMPTEISFDESKNDRIEIVINDSLDGLLTFRVISNGFVTPIRGEELL